MAGVAGRRASAEFVIAPKDRVTYAEAREITGRSHMYLFKLVRGGLLTRDGGRRGGQEPTWLSRSEVEGLALREYRRGRVGGYWMTMAQAAEALGVTRTYVYRMGLPVRTTGSGDLLLRRQDVARLVLHRRAHR